MLENVLIGGIDPRQCLIRDPMFLTIVGELIGMPSLHEFPIMAPQVPGSDFRRNPKGFVSLSQLVHGPTRSITSGDTVEVNVG